MRILVTGIAGFIGFHLAKRLAKKGDIVVGIDNINTYYNPLLKIERLKELGFCNNLVDNKEFISKKYKNLSFIKCDIANISNLECIFKKNNFDKVCNLAAQAGVRYSFENPNAYIESNIVGFANIISLSHKYKVKHFIYASSSSVYGNNEKIPFKESDNVDSPQSIYAATKKSNELIASVYKSQMGLPTTGLRFFTVYGPWGRPDMAPFIFLRNILNEVPIKVFNNGNLSRDFSYIDDIITGVIKVIENDPKKEIYNIGNSSPIKLMDFISIIEQVANKEAIKEFLPMQQGDVYITYASTQLMEKDYGFKPNTPLLYGITEFYNWYKNYYSIF